jgi:L-asparaginase
MSRRLPERFLFCLLCLAVLPWHAAGIPAAAVPVPITAAPAQTPLPRVRLIATGGTISNRQGARLTAEELVADTPGLSAYVRAEHEQFANTSSSYLTLGQWLDLSRRVNTLFRDDADLAGIVVTSGTDTLEELAWFLHLTVRDDRPVVVTGAMRTPSAVSPDGQANLLAAFRVAGDPAARGRGTLVVLNDEINSARDVTKSDALRLHTFVSRAAGPLGVVDADRVVFRRRIDSRHTARSEFDVFGIETLPRVDVLLVYQDAPGDLVRAAVDLGAKGLVIATAGAGAMSGTQMDGVRYALEQERAVAIATRTGAGRIPPQRERGWMLGAEEHAPVKARVLLMLALASGAGPADAQRIFSEY